MIINHNLNAMNAHRNMIINNTESGKSMEKLSSGIRINRAGDDAAGLAISEKMRSQIRGLDQAARNAQDGISMIQTAEGALNETHSILQRMRELSVQASNGTLTADDRTKIQGEIKQLIDEIDKIGNQTEFNTKKLLNGNIGVALTSSNTWADSTQKAAVVTLSSTSDTISGAVTVNVTTAATQSTSGNGGAFTGSFGTGAAITITNSGGTATVISIADNDDRTSVIEKINTYSEDTGVEAFANTDGGIKLRSTNYGANSTFTVSGNGTTLTKAGINNTVTAGSNLAATLSDGSTITVNSTLGNRATIDNGNLKGVTFQAMGTNEAAKATGLSVNAASLNGDYLTINGYQINLTTGQISNAATLASVINNYTRNTGVSAAIEGGRVSLTSAMTGDGVGIQFSYTSLTGGLDLSDGTTSLGDNATYNVVSGAGVLNASLTAATYSAGTDNLDNVTSDATLTSVAGSVEFHVGANQSQTMSLRVNDMRSANLATAVSNTYGWTNLYSLRTDGVGNEVKSEKSVEFIDAAISSVSTERGNLGAVQNRLEHTIANLNTSSENLNSSESRIRDVDMAKEIMNFSKNNILSQAAQAMLAQANQQPQGVLQLLR